MRDPALIRRIGQATAEEVAVVGGDWTFGPTVAVPRDDRWGRSYEGYAEDPEVVKSYSGPMTLGLQGELKPGQTLARATSPARPSTSWPTAAPTAARTRATPGSPRPSWSRSTPRAIRPASTPAS
jgi:hypothetical protein